MRCPWVHNGFAGGYMHIWKSMHFLSGKYASSFGKGCILFRKRMHPFFSILLCCPGYTVVLSELHSCIVRATQLCTAGYTIV
jgi:hypothetical protein